MKREYYNEEMMIKESITSQKNDQGIGMPDIESELKRVKMMAKKNQPTLFGWRRIAAVFIFVLSISGLAWAVVYYNHVLTETEKTEQPQEIKKIAKSSSKQTNEEAVVKDYNEISLSYDKATLEQIVVDLTVFYQLEQPVFENIDKARKFKMHVNINPKSTIQEAVDLLNKFGSVNIELEGNKLVVK